jgi:hypothetical protein
MSRSFIRGLLAYLDTLRVDLQSETDGARAADIRADIAETERLLFWAGYVAPEAEFEDRQ